MPPTTARCLRSGRSGGTSRRAPSNRRPGTGTRSRDHLRKARTLRLAQLAATGVGVVLAAVAGALPGSHLAVWTAAATTIAAAIGTHLAAGQHQRIAASYASTADQLERLIAEVDPVGAGPDRRARFVADVERVLAAQNSGWTDLFSA